MPTTTIQAAFQIPEPDVKPSPAPMPRPSHFHDELGNEGISKLEFNDRQRLLELAQDPCTVELDLMKMAYTAWDSKYHKQRRDTDAFLRRLDEKEGISKRERWPHPVEGDYDEEMILALLKNPRLPIEACERWVLNCENFASCAKGKKILRALAKHPATLCFLYPNDHDSAANIERLLRKFGDNDTVVKVPGSIDGLYHASILRG